MVWKQSRDLGGNRSHLSQFQSETALGRYNDHPTNALLSAWDIRFRYFSCFKCISVSDRYWTPSRKPEWLSWAKICPTYQRLVWSNWTSWHSYLSPLPSCGPWHERLHAMYFQEERWLFHLSEPWSGIFFLPLIIFIRQASSIQVRLEILSFMLHSSQS